MRYVYIIIYFLISTSTTLALGGATNIELSNKQWIHGSEDCSFNDDPPIDIFQFNESSYILRQNKCLSFEAPFIYVLFGRNKVLVVDTGATENSDIFPLYAAINSLREEHAKRDNSDQKEILVIHTHSHGDHHAGDSQFAGKPNVTVIQPNNQAVMEFFQFNSAENNEITIDLGARELTIFPTPGHQEEAITIYDSQTKWLLAGDTLYPGYIYVKNWKRYTNSIAQMASFAKNHEISGVLGAHIEMTKKPGEHYPIGTVFQPDEASLALAVEDLLNLNSKLQKSKKSKIVFNDFIIAPMSAFQKMMSRALKAVSK